MILVSDMRTWKGELGFATAIASVLARTVKLPVVQLEMFVAYMNLNGCLVFRIRNLRCKACEI